MDLKIQGLGNFIIKSVFNTTYKKWFIGFMFQEEEIVKPKQAKRRKKAISDSEWRNFFKKFGKFKRKSSTFKNNQF